jgi:hypothetical protein
MKCGDPPAGESSAQEGWCDVEENGPARDPGANPPRIPRGYAYEYDEAHDVQAEPLHETRAPHQVDSPPGLPLGEGGDYGYDEAHDFCARQSTKT